MSLVEIESGPVKGRDELPPADLLWGAASIARVLDRDITHVQYMLRKQQIKSAKKIGGKWVVSHAALLREFGAA
jgi:hypothetical protein